MSLLKSCWLILSTNEFCVTESFDIIEKGLPEGRNASFEWISAGMTQFRVNQGGDSIGQFMEAFWQGRLCTECMSGIFHQAKAMGYFAPEDRERNVTTQAKSKCGDSYGGENDQERAEVQWPSPKAYTHHLRRL